MNNLTSTPLQKLLQDAKTRSYPKGQIVIYQGETPSDLFVIKSGVIKIYDIDENGNEKIMHIMKQPSAFPFLFFMGATTEVAAFYTTLTACELYVLPQQVVIDRMRQDSEIAIALTRTFAHDAHELAVRIGSLEKATTRDKLIAACKFLAVHHSQKGAHGNWRRVSFPVSHQLLADMVGITRESTTMAMKELQEEKIVRMLRPTMLEINFAKLINL